MPAATRDRTLVASIGDWVECLPAAANSGYSESPRGRELLESMMRSPLHIALCDSAAGCLRAACQSHGIPGTVFGVPDNLSHGPRHDGRARIEYMRGCFRGCDDWYLDLTDAFAPWRASIARVETEKPGTPSSSGAAITSPRSPFSPWPAGGFAAVPIGYGGWRCRQRPIAPTWLFAAQRSWLTCFRQARNWRTPSARILPRISCASVAKPASSASKATTTPGGGADRPK